METAAAAMLEAGVGRFSRAPAMAAALVAEMWAPLAVVLAALATLPSLLRRLQVIVLRIRSRGKEVIQSHISTYYSSGDEEEDEDDENSSSSSDDEEEEASSSGDEQGRRMKRIGYLAEDDGCGFPWGGSVVRTWQALPCPFSAAIGEGSRFDASGAGAAAVRLWGAGTASGGDAWWSADEGGSDVVAAAEAEDEEEDVVVLGWQRDHAGAHRRRRRRRSLHGSSK